MRLHSYKGVIFDFDGTLVDTEPLYYKANYDALKLFGHHINENEYYHYWSLLGQGLQGEIERYGLDSVDVSSVRSIAVDNYHRLVQSRPIPLFPHAQDVLTWLPAKGFRIAIASNTERDLINKILTLSGIHITDVTVVGGDTFKPKPAPDIFLAALHHLGVDRDRCLILEDTDKGVRAARAAGIPFAIVHSRLYPEYNPVDAVGKFPDLLAFYRFLTEE
jgi:HAD superfamily hydrolase (TIGR01509 family)